jgi:hypothetical protein
MPGSPILKGQNTQESGNSSMASNSNTERELSLYKKLHRASWANKCMKVNGHRTVCQEMGLTTIPMEESIEASGNITNTADRESTSSQTALSSKGNGMDTLWTGPAVSLITQGRNGQESSKKEDSKARTRLNLSRRRQFL